MTKKISKKELKKFKEQMGISDIRHNRPPVGRPAVFVGVTSKRRRREGKKSGTMISLWLFYIYSNPSYFM